MDREHPAKCEEFNCCQGLLDIFGVPYYFFVIAIWIIEHGGISKGVYPGQILIVSTGPFSTGYSAGNTKSLCLDERCVAPTVSNSCQNCCIRQRRCGSNECIREEAAEAMSNKDNFGKSP